MSPFARILFVSLAAAGAGKSAPASSLPVVIEERTFQVRLPKGWHPKLVGRSGDSIPASPALGTSGESNLSYEGPDGRSLAVEVDPDAHGFCADADWSVRPSGNRVEIVEEGRLSPQPERDAEPDDEGCVSGDKVGVATQFDIRGHSYLVIFWTDRRRTGTDLPVFRAILRSFRAK